MPHSCVENTEDCQPIRSLLRRTSCLWLVQCQWKPVLGYFVCHRTAPLSSSTRRTFSYHKIFSESKKIITVSELCYLIKKEKLQILEIKKYVEIDIGKAVNSDSTKSEYCPSVFYCVWWLCTAPVLLVLTTIAPPPLPPPPCWQLVQGGD